MTAVESFTKKSLFEARMPLGFVKLHSCAKAKKTDLWDSTPKYDKRD